jgi:aminopeptidase N
MSTYLLALVLSDFECKLQTVQGIGQHGKVDIRVCGRSSVVANSQLDYALNVAIKVLKFYEDFYGIKYPLPKSGWLKTS